MRNYANRERRPFGKQSAKDPEERKSCGASSGFLCGGGLRCGDALDKGASHVAFLEESYYHVFQDRLISFLGSTEAADNEDNEKTDKAA